MQRGRFRYATANSLSVVDDSKYCDWHDRSQERDQRLRGLKRERSSPAWYKARSSCRRAVLYICLDTIERTCACIFLRIFVAPMHVREARAKIPFHQMRVHSLKDFLYLENGLDVITRWLFFEIDGKEHANLTEVMTERKVAQLADLYAGTSSCFNVTLP